VHLPYVLVDLRYVQIPFSFYRLTMPYLQADNFVAASRAERCYPYKSFPFDCMLRQCFVIAQGKAPNPTFIWTRTPSETNL